ncbi:MAG: ribonuclease HII [Acidilobus sp.]
MWVIGIDEAGRGSLVGELIIAAYGILRQHEDELVRLGVRDSKELTRARREELYRELTRLGVFVVLPITPREIDSENINRLEERRAWDLLRLLFTRIGGPRPVEAIYIDKFGELRDLPLKLRKAGFSGRLVVEPKADSRYPVVSAASIIAKVIRDRRIDVLRSMYGVRGSGYPADPETREWVMKVLSSGTRPPIIRYSWSTLEGTDAFVKKVKRSGRTLEDFMV